MLHVTCGKERLKNLHNNFGGFSLKKYITKAALLCLTLFASFSPKGLATDIDYDFEIDFIDKNSVVLIKNHCIEINDTKYKIGEKIVTSFWNTQEGRELLSQNVPTNLLSSILDFWDFSVAPAKSSKQPAKLSKSSDLAEVTVEEHTELGTLNCDKASFFIIKKVQIDDTYYTLGEPKEVSYENSLKGRQTLQNEINEPFYSLVMAVWGDTPTVISDELEK